MNIFDIGIVLIFLMFAIVGFKNGIIKEAFSFIGIIIIFIISYQFKWVLGNFLCTALPFIKFKGTLAGISSVNILFFQTMAFIIIFAILLGIFKILLKFSKFVQKVVNMTIILLIPSKLLGALVSVFKCYIILFVVFLFLMVPLKEEKVFSESTFVDKILYHSPVLSKKAEKIIDSYQEIYELRSRVSMETIDKKEANIKTLDIMLKHDVVDKSTVEKLVKMHKLDDIDNVDSILKKY